jgi:chemotaxis protein histidine kinase CheA
MARRRQRTSATGGNMDSMLDTLTNVVGILIIVLVTVQLSTQEAAQRIAEAVQKVDPAEVARLESEAADAKAAADAAQARLDAARKPAAKDPAAEAARLEAEATKAEQTAREAEARAAAIEKEKADKARVAKQSADAATKKAAEEKAKAEAAVAQAEAAWRALAAELEKTEKPIAPPAKEVRLPDPRPAPAGAKEIRVLCREGKVWVVNIPALQEIAQRRADFIVRQKKLDADGDQWLAEGKAFLDAFNDKPVREDGFSMTLALAGGKWTQLVLERMPGSGQTAEAAIGAAGDLARTLRRLDPGKFYVRFFVWPDGFEAYLAARAFTAERGFAAGWEPVGSPDEHRIGLGKYPVGTKPPPDEKPPAAKPPENVVD